MNFELLKLFLNGPLSNLAVTVIFQLFIQI